MDSRQKITVLCPNGRRLNIRISPETTLLHVLEEACRKHGFSSDDYGLKSHNKEIDLSLMFRYTGLPNNCVLEMFEIEKKRVESDAEICIQLEDGTRFQGKISPNTTLWNVVLEICPQYTEDERNPVIVYMRREIFKDELKETTLKELGITGGRTMLRLLDKKQGEVKTQAGVYVPQPSKEELKPTESSAKKPKTTSSNGAFMINPNVIQTIKGKEEGESSATKEVNRESKDDGDKKRSPRKVEHDWGSGVGRSMKSPDPIELEKDDVQSVAEEEPDVNVVGDRNAVIFSLDSVKKNMEELPDSFFDLSVTDLKLVLRDLKKISEHDEEAPLLTSHLRAIEENKTARKYKSSIIRVQFPDRYVLQAIFEPTDKIEDVLKFVKNFLSNENLPCYLFTIPPKTLMPVEKTLTELKCVPTALLHFGYDEMDSKDDIVPLLKPDLLTNLTSPEGAVYVATKFRTAELEGAELWANTLTPSNFPGPGTSSGTKPKTPRNEKE